MWPRDSFFRFPGEIHIEFKKPIEPGLNMNDFMNKLEKEIYDFSECTYDKEIIEKTFFESKVPFIVEEPLAPELIIWQNMDFVNPKNKYSIWDRYGLLCFNYIAQVVFAILFSVALTEL